MEKFKIILAIILQICLSTHAQQNSQEAAAYKILPSSLPDPNRADVVEDIGEVESIDIIPVNENSILFNPGGNTEHVDPNSKVFSEDNNKFDNNIANLQEAEEEENDISKSSMTSFGPVSSPFFFMCHYPRPGEPLGTGRDEVTVKVELTGTDTPFMGYEPHAIYQVLATSNVLFDGFMLTGVHAFTKHITESNYLNLPASLYGGKSEGLVCAILHSHISHKPRRRLSFLWMAPPPGTGCVAFLAQGSLGEEPLFKDLPVLEVCEKESSIGELKVANSLFAGVDLPGIVFRDDFESYSLDTSIWSNMTGGMVGKYGERILHGSAATFTSPGSFINTHPMDLSRAKHLVFALGSGSCPGSWEGGTVQLLYGSSRNSIDQERPSRFRTHGPVVRFMENDEGSGEDAMTFNSEGENGDVPARLMNGDDGQMDGLLTNLVDPPVDSKTDDAECTSWEVIHSYSVGASSEVHMEAIPRRYRRKGVCVRWQGIVDDASLRYENGSCWGIDNVAATTTQATSEPLHDDFDPVNPSNWMFFPGDKIQESCGSEGNSLVFSGGRVTTRLMDLKVVPPTEDIILEHYFMHSSPSGWQVEGGEILRCEGQQRLIFAKGGTRRVCTPTLDARSIGVISVSMQLRDCFQSLSGEEIQVSVFAEQGTQTVALRQYTLSYSKTLYTIPIEDAHNLLDQSRICIEQTVSGKNDTDIWALDHIRLLPWSPTQPTHFLQGRVNLECGDGVSQVEIESSADDGLTWTPLHRKCLPTQCDRQHSIFSSSIRPQDIDRWGLLTLPLPYFSLTPNNRFRLRNVDGTAANDRSSTWAIDNVYIGPCYLGCSGRGLCQPDDTCKCEYGYSGRACENPDHENPLYLSEPFTDPITESANIIKMTGGRSSSRCGVVGTGLAAVFLGGGPRAITTLDVNTTHAHFIQFHYVGGTISDIGKCPGPNHPSESVYVHYSCNGGVTWHLLHTLPAQQHKEPSHISLLLPPGARDLGCRFQIWQDSHSGYGRDVWAIDDLTVTSRIFNNIQLDFSDSEAVNNSLRFNLGELGEDVCGRDSAMAFDDVIATGSTRFIETKSIGVGPSYMIQFDLVIGCGEILAQDTANKIMLEYSLNHGISWRLIHRPCSPSTPGCESHFTRGTVYEHTEFKNWKRVTVRLPRHTWSPTTRLRLRQTDESDVSESWAVDNLFIGRQCPGLCSGHGYCTIEGCRCDDDFHGHECLPVEKLHREIDATFDEDDIGKYAFTVIGDSLVSGEEGCGHVVSGKSLYFGAPGIRQFETDDLNSEDIEIIQFMLVIGNGGSSNCLPSDEEEKLSAGSIVLEYSTDGGISWELMKELLPSQYRSPSMFRAKLEEEVVEADSGVVRFRIWQPSHDGKNQWAIDNLRVFPDIQQNSMQADFAAGSSMISPWMTVTKNHHNTYCNSEDLAQVMDGEEPVRLAVTHPLKLNVGDIISFKISVGCESELQDEGNPVMLQYSKDGGIKWSLVDEGCPSTALHCSGPREPSIYRPDHHGPWSRILLQVDHRLSLGAIQLRWIQDNPGETSAGEFSLQDLYIGPPCRFACHGHGLCTAAGLCKCDEGFNGTYCGRSPVKRLRWMHDDFDNAEKISPMWERAEGANVAVGCGPHHTGNALLFSASGPRFATTKELDTRNIKYLVFNLQIGSSESGGRCQRGQVPRDNVLLQHSADNGQTWRSLQLFEPSHTITRREAFFIPMPDEARTRQTRFRWWQGYNEMFEKNLNASQDERAEWHLDNVMVLANETLPQELYDSFDGNTSTAIPWFMTSGSSLTQGCGRQDSIMFFKGQTGTKYAETWEFAASESSVIQFDIKVGCEVSGLGGEVKLQYSNDHGKTWQPVWDLCSPPQVECETFHLPSTYSTAVHPDWTRITTALPKKAIGENTRLRLISDSAVSHGGKTDSWAIDNFFVGNSCPWMCSGHGYCNDGRCKCDPGYFGDYCVPASVLPCELLDTFNEPTLSTSYWLNSYGSEVSFRCGVIVSRSALVFFKDGLRLATSIDLDMTAGQFVQFSIHMGCKRSPANRNKRSPTTFLESAIPVSNKEEELPSRAYGILVQYSSNGGITWHLLKEIHYKSGLEPVFVSINLEDFPQSRSNATRFRIWQPRHEGAMSQSWAIDNIFIGGMPISPNVLYEDFNKGSPMTDAWVDWPAGQVGFLCDEHDSYTGLVFGDEEGEHALYTRDLAVDEYSVVQFDIKVGCGQVTGRDHNVSLQYSNDYGSSWNVIHPVVGVDHSSPDCLHELRTPTVFYPNSARKWTRVIIPLKGLQICGTLRFRWWQGYYRGKESSTAWSVDNIYIGPSCLHHCTGHGYCINGDQCVCDDDFEGEEDCNLSTKISQTLNEDFEAGTLEKQFVIWSGAEVSRFCGVLTGDALVFSQQGERMLITTDLDLSQGSVVQFYIRFGCIPDDLSNEDGPVLLQYSSDGGISWTLMAELGRDSGQPGGLPYTHHITLPLPESSKSNATRLRWWQPSRDGSFKSQWAVDQIHIGSSALGLPAFTDIDTGSGWLLRPGSAMDTVCGVSHKSLHFTSREGYRFAETPDILVNEHSFIQFTAALGCKDNGACFQVELEYSIDQGLSWWPIKESCLPSDPDCTEYWPSSILISDLYSGPTQVTMRLPFKPRTELTRIRFIQRDGYRQQHVWSLSHVYVGDECYYLCSGRGFCDAGVCHCHKGWTGSNCEVEEEPLPTFIVSEFTGEVDSSHWRKVVGAQVTGHCGVIASGQALHFTGGCSRYLETVDLDLREALFIQFDMRTGCLDPVSGRESGGDHSILVQTSCDAGLSWTTVKKLLLIYHQPTYVWLKLPVEHRCLGGRVRWWQPDGEERNRYDWAVDSVVVGGKVTPPDSITYTKLQELEPPMWIRRYNAKIGKYCENHLDMYVMMSTPSEPALIQTSDIQIGMNHSINFQLALGCDATWDSTDEPVRLEYSVDFGNRWKLVREMCLPGSSSCSEITDASVYYAPLKWNRYVYPLDHIGPAKYVRFRWIQEASPDVSGNHEWSLRDVYIGRSCPHHCLGRGSCLDAVCHCLPGYAGDYCQHVLIDNVPFIRDEFTESVFQDHFSQVQGGLLTEGCGGLEEPPTATFQGFYTRMLLTKPVDTRSGRFVHFTAQIGSPHGNNVCRRASHRRHNVFLQYSIDGGIRWHLLRELDHKLYASPNTEYILIPIHARSPATLFRFWQPRLEETPPAWSLDDLYIGGSEISPAQLMDKFEGEPTISEWLFAPHSENQQEYCSSGTNGSLVWGTDSPGHRAITTQELIVNEGHILQFKLSVGCGEPLSSCGGETAGVRLEYSRDGGVNGWELVMDSCLPGTSPDPDCMPYTFHSKSIFLTDIYSHWTRITLPLPEKTWSSTTQLRWVQNVAGHGNKVTPWSLDDVYVGEPCPMHCHGHGDCVEAQCICDAGFVGETCEPVPSRAAPLPTSLVDGFEAGTQANWLQITGGAVGLGCNSLAPYGHGKHLYFSGCGTRQAITRDMDTRRASKIMFVLRIGSQDNTPSCRVDLSDPQRALDKGIILQYTADNGVTWSTINVHDPVDFKKARRVAYSLPHDARKYGVQLRWWQPDHDNANTDQWALDNVEIVLAQRKDTSKYETKFFHEAEL